MSIQGDDAEKLADAVANLTNEVEGHPAVTNSALKTSLPLLAAMIPLIGIMAGIWFNFVSESRAREDEKDSRAREEEIRVMELAVPVYRNLAVQGAKLDLELMRCEAAIRNWWDTPEGSDEEKASQSEIDEICVRKVELAYSEVSAALEEAKLVSNEDLIVPVERFEAVWIELQRLQTEFVETRGAECDPGEEANDCFSPYFETLENLDLIGFCVFEEIRQNVLLQEERSSSEVTPDCQPYLAEKESE